MRNPIRVLFLASEAAPFIKVGGLGDVAGSLPQALRALPGAPDVRLVIPLHGKIERDKFKLKLVTSVQVSHIGGPMKAQVYETESGDVPVYMVSGWLFGKDAPVYSSDTYSDGAKYTFFSLAALALVRALDWRPDILHAHDWHAAPAVYALRFQADDFFSLTASLLTVHNLPYLGNEAGLALREFGLPPSTERSLPNWARTMALPLGLVSADKINTVSPGYAAEILTKPFGSGLHNYLKTRKEDISGILNGLDMAAWNPQTDPAIEVNYGVDTLEKRQENKSLLLDELGFKPDMDIPLLAFIGRMDHQKGVAEAVEGLRLFAKQPWRAVFLGTGNPDIEAQVEGLAAEFPEKVRAVTRYDEGLARRIYAGADMILIPSRYEPCGLIQMIAMRYGCVPVASAVGGLKDTIGDYDKVEDSTGFIYKKPSPKHLVRSLRRAFYVFTGKDSWQGVQRRGMLRDFSWWQSAQQYYNLYRTLITKEE